MTNLSYLQEPVVKYRCIVSSSSIYIVEKSNNASLRSFFLFSRREKIKMEWVTNFYI